MFYHQGIYGVGDGTGGYERLLEHIRTLASRPDTFDELGRFSRQFVLDHFSVESVSARLSEFCRSAVSRAPRLEVALADGVRTAAVGIGGRLVPNVLRNVFKGWAGIAR